MARNRRSRLGISTNSAIGEAHRALESLQTRVKQRGNDDNIVALVEANNEEIPNFLTTLEVLLNNAILDMDKS